ncbi:hypothetical protein QBC47DRAFT_428379 [Echria macrotheca]|uniref:Uncharacterized protein n=1 Tax=Echria macrotheca TaxID=438768 RepID=A0AAJ0BMJ3_9PEZI|nr:hypothetical protein QBC47DRAFT_428379 [Echria macrotheca]
MSKKQTNFRSYEAQSRLLAALIATQDNLRIDYKMVAKYFGGKTSESAIEHRFRPLKAAAKELRKAFDENRDPGDVVLFCDQEKTRGGSTNASLAAAFGESTPDGLQFQLRTHKAGADRIKKAMAQGKDTKEAFESGITATGTAAATTPSTGRGRKRKVAANVEPVPTPAAIAPTAPTPRPKRQAATAKKGSVAKQSDDKDSPASPPDHGSDDDFDLEDADEDEYQDEEEVTFKSAPASASKAKKARTGSSSTSNTASPSPFVTAAPAAAAQSANGNNGYTMPPGMGAFATLNTPSVPAFAARPAAQSFGGQVKPEPTQQHQQSVFGMGAFGAPSRQTPTWGNTSTAGNGYSSSNYTNDFHIGMPPLGTNNTSTTSAFGNNYHFTPTPNTTMTTATAGNRWSFAPPPPAAPAHTATTTGTNNTALTATTTATNRQPQPVAQGGQGRTAKTGRAITSSGAVVIDDNSDDDDEGDDYGLISADGGMGMPGYSYVSASQASGASQDSLFVSNANPFEFGGDDDFDFEAGEV